MPAVRPAHPAPPLSPWGWGDPELVPQLPDAVLKLLSDGLGVTRSYPHPPSLSEVRLTPPRLTGDVAAKLRGSADAHEDHESRARHALGRSTPDMLRLRSSAELPAPDLVLLPETHEQVLELLRIASEARVAVTPFGGGTSVVGGLEASTDGFRGWVALDLQRLDTLVELDERSRLAVLGPGLRGPQAEELLSERGYTIGHFPQSYEYATLGGFAAARSSGQSSLGYGRFDELVQAMRVATPTGTLNLGRAPRSAAGPDLRQLILGSEGTLGVITELTVAVRPVPAERVYDGWRLPSFAAGADALRRLAQDGPRPTVARLSDEAETALNLARPGELAQGSGGGCLMILGYEGDAEDVQQRRAGAADILRAAGGTADPGAGPAWAEERFRGPYLRDALVDAGALVETLETVTFWSRLDALYQAVGTALRDSLTQLGRPPVILCHVSHVYAAGASLYFTVGCAAGEDPLPAWHRAKSAAGDAIIAAGGSISHHHGIGRDHLPWYEQEVGELGMAAVRAVKARLDPAGILNPGILVGDTA